MKANRKINRMDVNEIEAAIRNDAGNGAIVTLIGLVGALTGPLSGTMGK